MRTFVEWIVRRRQAVLVLTALVTLVLAIPVRNLRNIVDTDSLHPQEHPYVIATKSIERLFGGHILLLVGVTARNGTILTPPILTRIRDITSALEKMPGAMPGKTISLASAKVRDLVGDADGLRADRLLPSIPQTAEDLRELEKKIARNPLLDGILLSRDRRTAAILVQFADSPQGYEAIEDEVEAAVAPYRDDSVEVLVTGQPVYMAALERFSARMAFLLPLAILITALVHYEAFRTIQGLVLPLVTALLSVVWGLGLMMRLGLEQLDPFSNAAPILIIAVAAGHAVQILKRYYEAYHALVMVIPDRREASRRAVVEAVSAIGPVMLAAGGIAAASFLSLLVFSVPSVRTFGILTATGVLSALVIELTFIPAMRASLPPPGGKAIARERTTTVWDRILSAAATLVLGQRRAALYVATAGLVATMLLGTTRIVDDSSVRDFFDADLPFRTADAAINERLAGTNNFSVFIEGDHEDAMKEPAVLEGMRRIQRLLEAEPEVGGAISLASFVADMNRAMHADDPTFETIPTDPDLVAQYLLLYSMSGSPGDFDSYVDASYRRAVVQAFVKTDSSAYVAELDRKLQPLLHSFGPGIRAQVAGSMTTPAALTEMVVRGKMQNMAMITIVVFVLSAALFRSVVAGLLVLVPLAMVALVNFGLMGWLGIPLQVATATVAALAIGVGADYAIYFTYRFREEISAGHDLDAAMRCAFATAGKASLYVASAVGGGYAVLMLSHGFHIHLWLGGMVALAMIVSAAAALLLYPALLLSLRPAFVFPGLSELSPSATAASLLPVVLLAAGLVACGAAQVL